MTAAWPPVCWVVTDGNPGMENQCLGLAEAMGLRPRVVRLEMQKVWREIALRLGGGWKFALNQTEIRPPWPDLMIATGRTSVVASLHIKKAAGSKTFVVQLQNPAVSVNHFDRVVAPAHDELAGDNVIQTEGALNRITSELMQDEATKWAPRFAHLPLPRVAVLLGGSNSSFRLGPKEISDLGAKLAAIARGKAVGLLVTPSRRTGDANMALLTSLLRDCEAVIWDGNGENPYYGMLSHAQSIVVTCDSINMISEACSTGKPVHVVQLPGHSRKFSEFQRRLMAANRIRLFNGALETWQYEPLQETGHVAGLIRAAYDAVRR